MSFAQSILSDVVTWTIKFLQAVALFCADVFILGVFGCQTFFQTFHCVPCVPCETDVAWPGLAPISGGFNVKIITVMPIQDKGPDPPSLIILKLTRQSLITTGSRGEYNRR